MSLNSLISMNDIWVIPSVHALENIWTPQSDFGSIYIRRVQIGGWCATVNKIKNTTCNFTSQRINFLMFLNFLDSDEMRFFSYLTSMRDMYAVNLHNSSACFQNIYVCKLRLSFLLKRLRPCLASLCIIIAWE